jgi:hypothetical protein
MVPRAGAATGMGVLRAHLRPSKRAAPVHCARWYFANAADAAAFRKMWLPRDG